MSNNTRLLAIDPSLTASGWALFSLASCKPQQAGVIYPPKSSYPLAYRLKKLQEEVETLLTEFSFTNSDILVCEAAATIIRNPMSAMKVERVRGIFETVARSNGCLVPGRINPRTVQSELLGMSGKQLPRKEVKEQARLVAEKLFPQINSNKKKLPQDVIDALLIGELAINRIRLAGQTNSPLSAVFDSKEDINQKNYSQNFNPRNKRKLPRR
ncbi:MAG: crossover junction endodeoxyribonuclease RuvC [bacterium]|nr:crossover junction endodeoxyribonuclease RuvC [bacterium]